MKYKTLYPDIVKSHQYFEAIVAYHLAPVVMGIKSAGLVSLTKDKICMKHIKSTLHTMNLKALILGTNSKKICMLIYSPVLLKTSLHKNKTKTCLEKYGYAGMSMKKSLRLLQARYQLYVAGKGGYPHEIGLFLDYPPEDVTDFMNQSKPLKLCGYWKVFNNEQEARKTFQQYDLARNIVINEFLKGKSLLFIRKTGKIQYKTFCMNYFA